MRGVILAGGRGTRLLPLTRAINKQLLPVGGEPMIFHPIRRLVESGIQDILIITGPDHAGQIMQTLQDGHDLGCRLTYKVQPEPKGIAHAIGLAEDFVDDQFIVLLGDNIFAEPLTFWIDRVYAKNSGMQILIKQVADPQRFGVPEFDVKGKLLRVHEKPEDPPSIFAAIGAYGFCEAQSVFGFIRKLSPSKRGELEITDLMNIYAESGLLRSDCYRHDWVDAGTLESLTKASQILKCNPPDVPPEPTYLACADETKALLDPAP